MRASIYVTCIALWLPVVAVAGDLALPGQEAPVRVEVDPLGIPHVFASRLIDVARAQGYLHARERFFQMDMRRRQARGTLAALTGSFLDLGSDGQARLAGFAESGEREVAAMTAEELALLEAYAAGVNHFLATSPLPPEYAELEITAVDPWDPVDSAAFLKAFETSLSRNLRIFEIADTADLAAYEAAGVAQGFDGRALFFEDAVRFAPIVPAATVPDAGGTPPLASVSPAPGSLAVAARSARLLRERAERAPLLRPWLERPTRGLGSNVWGVAGSVAERGAAIVASDSHLGLAAPSMLFEMRFVVEGDPVRGDLRFAGMGVAGIPLFFVAGHNGHLAWGTAAYAPDIADAFTDRLVRGDPTCATRLCIESEGVMHPVEEHVESYGLNRRDDGQADNVDDATPGVEIQAPQAVRRLVVPFRSWGPVVQVDDRSVVDDPGNDPAETPVITIQAVNLETTRDLRGVIPLLSATTIEEFRDAVRLLAGLPANFVVADGSGRIAYLTSLEVPLRADLEAGAVVGNPPFLVRDGSGPNNWISDPLRLGGQTIPYAVLPPDEVPELVDPPAGFLVNANNDPLGGESDNDYVNSFRPGNPAAIHYLGPFFVDGLRAGRITQLLQDELLADGSISEADMKRFQANTQMLDAELLVPLLVAAWDHAGQPGAPAELAAFRADADVDEAVGRLAAWDFSTPTGIPEGYDAADVDGERDPVVSPEEAAHSVAATLYAAWRGVAMAAIFEDRLAALGVPPSVTPYQSFVPWLRQSPFTGVGASGVDFFPEPAGLTAEERRDVAVLQALRDALDVLVSNPFAAAFGNSTVQDDYRWGRLHRRRAPHATTDARSIPPSGGFEDLAPDLRGFANDGGYETVNPGYFFLDLDGSNAALSSFPASGHRLVMSPGHPDAGADGVLAWSSLPGGTSGDADNPFYANRLGNYLTVDYDSVTFRSQPLPTTQSELQWKCLVELNKRGAAVLKAQGKEGIRCLGQAAKGKEADPQGCLASDASGKVAKARAKTADGEAKRCDAASLPTYAYTGGNATNDAAVSASLGLAADVLGSDWNASVVPKSTDAAGAKCQAEALKRSQALADAAWKLLNKAKKKALKGKDGPPAQTPGQLETALAAAFADGKLDRQRAKLEAKVVKACGSVTDLEATLPGACADADPAIVGACLSARGLCRACLSANAFDDLALDCDALDGVVDASCP